MTTVYRPNVRSNTRPGLFPSLLSTLVLLGAVALPTQAQPIRVEIDPSIKPQNPELLLKPLLDNAEAALKARRFDDAVRYYQSATEYEPDNERIYSALGFAQSQRGDFRASAEAFRRAIASTAKTQISMLVWALPSATSRNTTRPPRPTGRRSPRTAKNTMPMSASVAFCSDKSDLTRQPRSTPNSRVFSPAIGDPTRPWEPF
ncbi:MAG: tetratricopeptide repeat protein [Synechococcales cyanobacterium CRU_2_2]|nr:tetratricopeptide repeat protein [Synechococcales cyanobacterium CRU_2_2]